MGGPPPRFPLRLSLSNDSSTRSLNNDDLITPKNNDESIIRTPKTLVPFGSAEHLRAGNGGGGGGGGGAFFFRLSSSSGGGEDNIDQGGTTRSNGRGMRAAIARKIGRPRQSPCSVSSSQSDEDRNQGRNLRRRASDRARKLVKLTQIGGGLPPSNFNPFAVGARVCPEQDDGMKEMASPIETLHRSPSYMECSAISSNGEEIPSLMDISRSFVGDSRFDEEEEEVGGVPEDACHGEPAHHLALQLNRSLSFGESYCVPMKNNPLNQHQQMEIPSSSSSSLLPVVVPRSRFEEEFEILGTIGEGSFGTVFRVRKRLDGCMYAVKRVNQAFPTGAARERVLKEVYALAAIEHDHVVRYFSAWVENDDRLYIQTELCDASLEQYLRSSWVSSHASQEILVRDLLRQLLTALKSLHAKNVVHLDIKPENIFVKQGVYKLGDLGHAALAQRVERRGFACEEVQNCERSLPAPPPSKRGSPVPAATTTTLTTTTTTRRPPLLQRSRILVDDKRGDAQRAQALTVVADIDEGDSRYMPRELLMENHNHLTKADIFSLAASAYEAYLGRSLAANGEEWTRLRDGVFDPVASSRMSEGMRELLSLMMHPDPTKRPSAEGLLATGGPLGILQTEEEMERSKLEREVQQLRDVAHHSSVVFNALRRVNTL